MFFFTASKDFNTFWLPCSAGEKVLLLDNKQEMKRIQCWILSLFTKHKTNREIQDEPISKRDYVLELLQKEEYRMIGSQQGLQGHYDADIELNREIQTIIKKGGRL
jgi:hypothetical protein